MWWRLVLVAGVALFVTACETEREEPIDLGPERTNTIVGFSGRGGPRTGPGKKRETNNVHKITCGCTLGRKHQTMVQIEGSFVPMVASGSPRAFCGKKDLEAIVKGEMKDGAFHPTFFQLIHSKR